MPYSSAKFFHVGAIASLLGLILLSVAWELVLAPLRTGGSWMVLKALPLLIPLRGAIKRDIYTLQWSSMLILLYFVEGIVRANSDKVALSANLAWLEVVLSSVYFFCAIFYVQPYKKAARKLAHQTIQKASK